MSYLNGVLVEFSWLPFTTEVYRKKLKSRHSMFLTEEMLQHNNARVANGQGPGSLWGMTCSALVQGDFIRFLDLANKNKGFSGKLKFQVNNKFFKA